MSRPQPDLGVPFIGFSNDALAARPDAPSEGTMLECMRCGGEHPLRWWAATDGTARLLGSVRCGDKDYLAAVAGKLIQGMKPSVSGRVDV